MFIKYEYLVKNGWRIIDSTFEETVFPYPQTVWHGIIEVYSKRELNVWSNFIRATRYCIEINPDFTIQSMIAHFALVGIKVDNLDKYLMLL